MVWSIWRTWTFCTKTFLAEIVLSVRNFKWKFLSYRWAEMVFFSECIISHWKIQSFYRFFRIFFLKLNCNKYIWWFFRDYYRELDGRVIPLRWLSPEALYTNSYSFKSEVWSFGVTCWEIFMLGKFPYEGVEDEQLIRCKLIINAAVKICLHIINKSLIV